MVWVKISDDFTDHPKIERLSDRAFRLHVAGLCHCARTLSDGFVADDRVKRLLPRVSLKLVDELVDARVWRPAEGGYQIIGFLEYNRSKAQVDADRAAAAKRKADWNAKKNGVKNAVPNGGGNASPTRPDPARPEGSRAGDVVSDSSLDPEVDTSLPEEQVRLNTERISAARAALKAVPGLLPSERESA